MYKTTVVESNRESLTGRERIMLMDTGNALSIDSLTQQAKLEGQKCVIGVDTWALLKIENDKADDKEYENIVILDREGEKYVTGSKSFISTFLNIARALKESGDDDLVIQAFRKESKNYKGKDFITCSLV